MQYELKKAQLIQQVQFKNLLSFSLVQNKLQRNFRSIVQALLLNQSKTDALNEDHSLVKQQHSKQISNLKDLFQQMKKQLQAKNDIKNSQLKGTSHQSVKLLSNHEIEPVKSTKKIEKTQKSLSNSQETQSVASNLAKNMDQKMSDWQNEWNSEKEDLMKQIDNLKNKVDTVGYLEDQFKSFRIDLRLLKDQLSSGPKNSTAKSSKGMIKRQSILNMVTHKNSEKNLQKKQQPPNNSIKILGKDTNKGQDKQNDRNPNVLIQTVHPQANQQNTVNQNFEKQINSLYLDINTLKISFEELRDMLSDAKKQVYKNNSLMTEVKDDLNRQVKTRKSQNQEIQKTLKNIKMQMLDMQPMQISLSAVQPQQKTIRDPSKSRKATRKEEDDQNQNQKNQLNDKMSRMQTMIQNLATQSELNRFKNQINEQLQKLGTKIQGTDSNLQNTQKKLEDLIVQYQVNTNQQLSDMRSRMSSLEEELKNQTNQNQRKNNILQAKLEQLKKALQNLREDMEFYQSLMAENNASAKDKRSDDNTTTQTKPKTSTGVDDKALQALKKYFSGKMHDLRTNLLGLIRELEKKMNNKSNGDQQFINIWDKLNEINLFMNKKADQDDTKKTYLYLEKKINRLNSQIFKNEDNTEDARIARSNNWQCLSCDKNLQAYQGKIGKHVIWETMPLKGINKSVVTYQSQEKKKGLPQLKK